MKTNHIKLLAILIFTFLFGVLFLQTNNKVLVRAEGDIAAEYKKNCAACHGAGAAKFYDTAKEDTYHIEVILKGKKGEKPPFMPAFETKGITPEQAKAYAEYMRKLRTPEATNTNTTGNTTANVITNTNCPPVTNVATPVALVDVGEETIAFYKKNCMACHTPTAAKFFDTTKENAVLEDIVLKGKKGEKPPFMPEYASKGVTTDQAKNLVAYMKQLQAK